MATVPRLSHQLLSHVDRPVFAFFLVLLMFKLLKEGIERECPNPPSSPFVDSSVPRRRPSRLNLMLPISRHIQGVSHSHVSSAAVGASGGGGGRTRGASTGGTVTDARSPSMDTVISLPPPYDSQTMGPVVAGDLPPSYEEATRKE